MFDGVLEHMDFQIQLDNGGNDIFVNKFTPLSHYHYFYQGVKSIVHVLDMHCQQDDERKKLIIPTTEEWGHTHYVMYVTPKS